MNEDKRDWTEDQRICDAATEGPWEWYDCGYYISVANQSETVIDDSGVIMRPNSRFITEARTRWPAALERIRVQDAEIARYREALEWYADEGKYHDAESAKYSEAVLDEGYTAKEALNYGAD